MYEPDLTTVNCIQDDYVWAWLTYSLKIKFGFLCLNLKIHVRNMVFWNKTSVSTACDFQHLE